MIGSPLPPATAVGTPSGSGALIPAGTYVYGVTAENERGEGVEMFSAAVTVAAGQQVALVIAGVAGASLYNVYRGTSASNAYYIGRIAANGSSSVTFTDLGNKSPGFVTGYLVPEGHLGIPRVGSVLTV